MRAQFLMVSSLLLMTGCTSNLAVKKIVPGTAVDGYPHQLKFTQFEIPVTWRVVACDPTATPHLKFKVSADPTHKGVPDPSQYYALDPRGLQGLFRHTEFGMEWYDDRTTKAINSSVDDQSGAAITGLLTTAVNLAGADVLPFGNNQPQCEKSVTDALAAIDGDTGQEAQTRQAQAAVEAQTLVVTRLAAQAAAAGVAVDDSLKRKLQESTRLLETLNERLGAEQKVLNRLLAVLTDKRIVTWPTTGDEFASTQPLMAGEDARRRWNMPITSTGAHVYFALQPMDGQPLPTAASMEAQAKVAPRGVPYREPRPMKLLICATPSCGQEPQLAQGSADIIKGTDVLVLQGGTMFFLPFRAKTFAHIKSSAGYAQSGVLTSAGTSQPRGAGTGIVDAMKGGSEQVKAFVKAQQGADTQRMLAQAEEDKAKKALLDARAALSPASDADKQALIKAYQTDATLAAAEKAKLDAEAALKLARNQAVP